jgi:hypothetical protein
LFGTASEFLNLDTMDEEEQKEENKLYCAALGESKFLDIKLSDFTKKKISLIFNFSSICYDLNLYKQFLFHLHPIKQKMPYMIK